MALTGLTIVLILAVAIIEADEPPKKTVAKCVMKHKHLDGVIIMEQKKGKKEPLIIKGEIHGLKPGYHGMHVHTFGDLGGKECEKTGPHFNPHKVKHGDKNDEKGHLGDLGNIKADSKGMAKFEIKDEFMNLDGKYSILGRSIKVHAYKDDLGEGKNEESHINGNSGYGVGCCIIGEVNEKYY